MPNKNITLIILRADRELWDAGPSDLTVTDLRKGLNVLKRVMLKAATHTIQINLELPFDAGQVYGISIDADRHRPAWQLITRQTFVHGEGAARVEVDGAILQLMLVPNDPSSSDLDEGYDLLRDAGSPTVADNTGLSKDAYLQLEPAAKMAFLNIDAKLRDTRVNGISLLSFVEGFRDAEVDRLFLFMRSGLKQLVNDSADFAGAQGHGVPAGTSVPLPAHPDSWKHTRFGAGNLQVSFTKAAESLIGDTAKQVFSVDADIDLERGLLHVAEWLDNKIIHPSRKTNQTLVYALLFSQGIIPHYTLNPEGV
jgi:hypothetical protein